MPVTSSVPQMSGRTPKCGGSKSGAQFVPVRKSTIGISWKNSNAGTNSAIDDPDRRRDRDQRADAEDALDDVLARCGGAGRGAEAPRPQSASGDANYEPDRGFEVALRLLELRVGERHELRRLGDLDLVLEHVARGTPPPRAAQRLLLHVDEERARERLVRAVLRGLDARRDAAVAAVDLDRLQRVLVLLEVREAEVAEAALLSGDAGDDRVVVLARRVVGAARALLAVDLVR